MKNKILLLIIFLLILFPINIFAKSGCCSWHGGVAGCRNGRQVCRDGTLSPTCTCYSSNTPSTNTNNYTQTNYVQTVYGCMDPTAKNYNPSANKSSSCTYFVMGCTDKTALNYNEKAEKNDGSCIFKIYGCTDKSAGNYNKYANTDDGSCKPKKEGCTMYTAKNYDKDATHDNKSCIFNEYKFKYTEQNSNNIINIIYYTIIISIVTLIGYLNITSKLIK